MRLVQDKLTIGGMSCVNCQNRIEFALASLPGVQRVSVSYQSGDCSISYDNERVSLRQIKEKIEDLGYQVLPQAVGTDMSRTVCFLIIIIALYIMLQRLGILNLLVPIQLADSGMGYRMLFVVGLLTSVYCVAMCGGINLSQSLPQGGNTEGQRFLPSIFYNLGRVISYTVIGFLLGLVGLVLGGSSDAGIPVLLQGVLKLIAGTVMVVMGINMLNIFPWLRRLNLKMPNFLVKGPVRKMAGSRRPLVVGLLGSLMPCGPLQSMQILALASGNPLTGALSMLLFSLGTVPLMLGLGTLVSALGKRFAHAVMNVGAVLVAVLGLSMLSQGGALSGMLLPDRLLFLVIGLAVVGIAASVPMTRKFDFAEYNYIVDAIDTVTGKIALAVNAGIAGTPIISSMGAGNKLDPTAFEVADIYQTSVCPLAKVMRHELKRHGVEKLKVVYSKEPPLTPIDDMAISCRAHCICPPGTARKCTQRRQVPSSNAFVPSVVGLIIAGEVIKDLSKTMYLHEVG